MNSNDMKLSAKPGIQHIVLTLAALGLREVIICPGSRNAPLVISFNRHPGFHCTVVRDERSAAFFALGKAIQLKQPVAVLCTSGSAALNFAPAISEAYYQRIPLVAITADRPKEWTNQGDGQTINQTDLYKNFIRKSYDLKGDASTAADFWYNQRSLSEGFNTAMISDPGPVHFNIPLGEPLYQAAEVDIEPPRVFREMIINKQLTSTQVQELQKEFSACKRIMVIAGQHPVDRVFNEQLSAIAGNENVVVLTESTSNVHDPQFVEHIDRCISTMTEEQVLELVPDLLITVGSAVVSKRIKAFLRKNPPKYHWNVHPFDCNMDTFQVLTRAIPMEPATMLQQLLSGMPRTRSDYRMMWLHRKNTLQDLHDKFCDVCEHSDFAVFRKIYETMPGDIHLHLSNSSPVRYAQLFDNKVVESSWSNRGTSGIDGCTSTAMGAASASPDKQFVLITGDVAFYYDINGLWNDATPDNLKIILINNGGGGIFRIISGPDKVDELEEFFETSMQSNAKNIAQHFGWHYMGSDEAGDLASMLKHFFNPRTKRTILEIFTDAEKNPVVLDEYWRYLKENSKTI